MYYMYIHTKGKIQLNNLIFNFSYIFPISRVRRGRDRVVVGFISLRSGLLLEETGVTGENHRSVGSHWQSFSHNVILSKPRLNGIRIHNVSAVVIGTDCICNYKSNYHAITTTTDPTNREYVRKIEN
jgi:hypothetical protein